MAFQRSPVGWASNTGPKLLSNNSAQVFERSPCKSVTHPHQCAEMGLPSDPLFCTDPLLRPLRHLPDFTALLSDVRLEYDQYRGELDLVGKLQPE